MRTDLFLGALIAVAGIAASAQAAPSAAELEQGGNLFIITCSSSFCHGDGGVGARGPSLRNRNFPPDFVRNTVLNGRSGTPMPSFKDSLSAAEIALIVNFVMSLSPNNHQEDTGESAAATAAIPLSDQAQRGFDIFFDETKPDGCNACHSYGGKGGLVGPDLSTVAAKAAAALYQSIVHPAVWTDYPFLTVSTRDGPPVTGIKHDRDDKQVGIYDVSSTPPVLRTYYAADGASVVTVKSPLYKHEMNGYSVNQIADLIAFLKSANGDGKTVNPQDLGLK